MPGQLTKVVVRVTRASSVCPSATFWAMGKEVVLVSNVLKEVNLVFALEESSGNAMHYCVSPALSGLISDVLGWKERNLPHSRNLRKLRGARNTSCMLRHARGSYRRFQNYSRLVIVRNH